MATQTSALWVLTALAVCLASTRLWLQSHFDIIFICMRRTQPTICDIKVYCLRQTDFVHISLLSLAPLHISSLPTSPSTLPQFAFCPSPEIPRGVYDENDRGRRTENMDGWVLREKGSVFTVFIPLSQVLSNFINTRHKTQQEKTPGSAAAHPPPLVPVGEPVDRHRNRAIMRSHSCALPSSLLPVFGPRPLWAPSHFPLFLVPWTHGVRSPSNLDDVGFSLSSHPLYRIAESGNSAFLVAVPINPDMLDSSGWLRVSFSLCCGFPCRHPWSGMTCLPASCV